MLYGVVTGQRGSTWPLRAWRVEIKGVLRWVMEISHPAAQPGAGVGSAEPRTPPDTHTHTQHCLMVIFFFFFLYPRTHCLVHQSCRVLLCLGEAVLSLGRGALSHGCATPWVSGALRSEHPAGPEGWLLLVLGCWPSSWRRKHKKQTCSAWLGSQEGNG